MATSRSCYPRPSYRFLPTDHQTTLGADSAFELDESDIYNFARSSSPDYRKPVVSSPSSAASKKSACSTKRSSDGGDRNGGSAASSLPVGIPDWSKILRDEYRENRRSEEEEEDCFQGTVRVPPHEFLARQMARTRIASFSVHEGVGRTLKGRDLSRVRNAI